MGGKSSEETMKCELCSFKNPKGTVTAIIIKDNKLLLLKRNEAPFKGKWDLPGGYMQEGEHPEDTLKRELVEELSVSSTLTEMVMVPGTATWKRKTFPIINHVYLAEIHQDIVLDKENSAYKWVPIKDLKDNEIAFYSNQDVVMMMKKMFAFDLDRIRELISQLDKSAYVNEYSLYKAIINGYISTVYDNGKLIGMGWIFPRQTLLRRQAVVEDMIVDEEYRGKGLGKRLINDLIKWAEINNMDMVELTTNPLREAANHLYKSVGFKFHPTNHYLYKVNKNENYS